MNKLNLFSLVLMVCAFFIFIGTYYYHQKHQDGDLMYAKTIVSFTSILSGKQKQSSPILTSQGYVITEQRGMLFFILFAVLLLVISLILVVLSNKQQGDNKLHFPIVLLSLLMIILILKTTHTIGLFNTL